MIATSPLFAFFTRATCCIALTASLHSAASGAVEVARAETTPTAAAPAGEFATIPNGDALYGFWTQVQRAPWFVNNARADKAATAKVPNAKTTSMTRYELALETGRASFALAARAQTDAQWVLPPTQRGSVRALRELLTGLRPELRRLQVDVNEAITLCDVLLSNTNAQRPVAADAAVLSASSSNAPARTTGTPTRTVAPLLSNDANSLRVPLSQRLRVYAALSSLEREANDPFGDRKSSLTNGAFNSATTSRAAGGAAFDVADWLRVRAGFEGAQTTGGGVRSLLNSANSTTQINSPLLGSAQRTQAIGGGVDIELRRGLTLSGDVARVAATNLLDNNRTTGTRIAGGVGVSAWQNRLALSMNLSRLVPEDSDVLSSSAAGLNLAVGNDRLKLNLLYQQLFGDAARTRGDRVIAGGININF